jgi:BirA family biotin operon repressor/biotin-[acetyl-CoA-carboxylase] ligase
MNELITDKTASGKNEKLQPEQIHAIMQVAVRLFNNGIVPPEELLIDTDVSPALVAFACQFLQDAGCQIRITKDGVELVRLGFSFMPIMLSIMLRQANIDLEVAIVRAPESTNDECFAAAARGKDIPLVILAEEQTRGRGRRGNRWEAKPGQSALLSLLLPARDLPVETLALAAGLAVAESVGKLTGRSPELKWPNDVRIDDRKIAGILIETRPNARNSALTDYVIGVGLNVMQTHKDFPPELARRAISLSMINRGEWDITNVAWTLLEALHHRCNPLATADEVVALWRSHCRMLGQNIRVSRAGTVLEGTVADIDPLEGLILRDHHGINHACLACQTTVLTD